MARRKLREFSLAKIGCGIEDGWTVPGDGGRLLIPLERFGNLERHRFDQEFARMSSPNPSLIQQIETRVRESTHGRIRNLTVEEVKGHLVVRGQVPSHHTRQLALHGALELLSGDRFSAMITVG
jgi:hypothetical protein